MIGETRPEGQSDPLQAELSQACARGTNQIVWRCATCMTLIEQVDLPVETERGILIHRPPERCPKCGSVKGFELIDED